MVPDRSYATMYPRSSKTAKRNGQFDPATMGSVANVGLMAKKAEEYGSHDKTFEAPADGIIRVVDADGNVLLEQRVETGDIFRMCQAKDDAIRDWVKLGVTRARATGSPAVFWLDENRGHDAEIIARRSSSICPSTTPSGLELHIMAPVEAMRSRSSASAAARTPSRSPATCCVTI
jgi:isocitrate dehydrogenase